MSPKISICAVYVRSIIPIVQSRPIASQNKVMVETRVLLRFGEAIRSSEIKTLPERSMCIQ
eukprot:scaffold694_cov180-Alexandrium_tamarense.AAC.3